MNNILWLVRREVWENRSLWIVPLVVAGVILIVGSFGGIHVNGNDSFWFGTGDHAQEFGPKDPDHRRMIYGFTISMFTVVQLVACGVVVFFYLLDSLLGERKDRSILFWKSLPLSDAEIVASKLLTALVAAPLFVLLVSALMQVLFAPIWSLRFGGTPLANMLMSWDGGVWVYVQAMFWLIVPTTVVWYLPIAGYLLVVSAWARKNAFLWAILPPLSLLAIEEWLMDSHYVGHFLSRRFGGMFEIMAYEPTSKVTIDNALRELVGHVGAVFTHAETWYNVLAAAVLIFAAIRIRRYRDDS